MYKEKDIIFESGRYFVVREPFKNRHVLKVFEMGLTHTTLAATIDWREQSLERAKEVIKERQERKQSLK